MGQPNPNDTNFEQQKSPSEVSSLENQVDGNYATDSEAATDSIAKNLEEEKDNKSE